MPRKPLSRWALECEYKRKERGLLWEEVAKDIGLSRQAISNTVHGKVKSDNIKKKLCNYFGVSTV